MNLRLLAIAVRGSRRFYTHFIIYITIYKIRGLFFNRIKLTEKWQGRCACKKMLSYGPHLSTYKIKENFYWISLSRLLVGFSHHFHRGVTVYYFQVDLSGKHSQSIPSLQSTTICIICRYWEVRTSLVNKQKNAFTSRFVYITYVTFPYLKTNGNRFVRTVSTQCVLG